MNTFFDLLRASRYSGTSHARNIVVSVIAWIAALLYVVTAWFLLTRSGNDAATKDLARAYLILWTIVPPTWFWVEHHLIWETANPTERGDFEHFKHSQELSRNIWLAFVGVLAALYFK